MSSSPMSSPVASDVSRFAICACADVSSAESGSSSTITDGVGRERPRDRDPLPLAAGELVREARGGVGRQADLVEQLDDAERPLRARQSAHQAVGELRADLAPRVQRRERVLEDHLQASPGRGAARGA